MKLLSGMMLIILAQLISYIQLQGQGKWQFFKKYQFIVVFFGLPIGYLLINSTRLINSHFGQTWQGRLIGQGIGVIVFSLMSYFMFDERITIKTGICITLSIIVILINIYWK
jgi:hypothetical protein